MTRRWGSPGSRVRRWTLRTVVAVLLAAVGLAGAVVLGNSYDLREERVSLRAGGRNLDAVLATPEHGKGPFGLVVFVHGDGPVDATHDGFYRPLWEAFARAGYASLSWSKPGVGGSAGDWLDQSMDDRAAETADAVAWARTRPGIDAGRIGLWGASQAGWVLPKVAARTPGIRFVIAVSPAVNWLRQGRYNTLAELRDRDAPPEETAAALARREAGLRVLRAGGTYEQYRAAVPGEGAMTAARWRFASRNWTSDATGDLRALAARRVPVLLVLAGHDLNVDVRETEAVYRRELPPATLRVAHYPEATHALVHPWVDRDGLRTLATALLAPRSLFAPSFLPDQQSYVAEFSPRWSA